MDASAAPSQSLVARTRPSTPIKDKVKIPWSWRNSFDSRKTASLSLESSPLSTLPTSLAPELPVHKSDSSNDENGGVPGSETLSRPVLTPKTILARPKTAVDVAKAPAQTSPKLPKATTLASTTQPASTSPKPTAPIPKRVTPRREFQSALQCLPLYSYKDTNSSRKVTYSRQMKKSNEAAERLLQDRVQVVGFDLEWKPMHTDSTYNRVSLVQVAAENEIILVQLDGSNKFPPALKAFLEDPTILKVGAGIHEDAKKLFDDWQVSLHHYLDLAHLARALDPFWNACDATGSMVIEGALGWETTLPQGKEKNVYTSPITTSRAPMTPTSPKDTKNIPRGSTTSLNTTLNDDASSILSRGESSGHDEMNKSTPPSSPPVNSAYTTPPSSDESFDLQRFSYGGGLPIALVRLVARYQGKGLDKGCQLSNWAAPLNKKQIEYAANDGCASLDIYNTLMNYRSLWTSQDMVKNIQASFTKDTAGSPQTTRTDLASAALESSTSVLPSPPITPISTHRSTTISLAHRHSLPELWTANSSIPFPVGPQSQALSGIPQPYPETMPLQPTRRNRRKIDRSKSKSQSLSHSIIQGMEADMRMGLGFLGIPPQEYHYPGFGPGPAQIGGPFPTGAPKGEWPGYAGEGYFPPPPATQYGPPPPPQQLYPTSGPGPNPMQMPYPTPNSNPYPYMYPPFQHPNTWIGNPLPPVQTGNQPHSAQVQRRESQQGSLPSASGWYPTQLAPPPQHPLQPFLPQPQGLNQGWQVPQEVDTRRADTNAPRTEWDLTPKKDGAQWTGDGWIPTPMSMSGATAASR